MSHYKNRRRHGRLRKLTRQDILQRAMRNLRRKRHLRLWEKKTIKERP